MVIALLLIGCETITGAPPIDNEIEEPIGSDDGGGPPAPPEEPGSGGDTPPTGPGEEEETGPSAEYAHLLQLHVGVEHPEASDDNSGTEERPLRTLAEALQRAYENRRNPGEGTRIVLHRGVYRESIVRHFPDYGNDLIVIEGASPGNVVISGSDVWTEWDCSGDTCRHHWPYDWGTASNPWSGNVDIGELARRRELVVVNGEILDQYMRGDSLSPGSFRVDETADVITVRLPEGLRPGEAVFEVGVRGQLLRLQSLHNIVLKGLVFQHATPVFGRAAVDIVNQRDVLLEDCIIRQNGQGGLSLLGDRITVRRCVSTENGGSGMTAQQSTDLTWTDTASTWNNWRGERGGFSTWSVGDKILHTHRFTVKRHESVGNYSSGMWLDTDVENVVLEDVRLCDNFRNGLYLEALVGPIEVRDTLICDNGDSGILAGTVENLTLDGVTIRGSGGAEVRISGASSRSFTDMESGARVTASQRNWAIRNTTIAADGSSLLYDNTLSSDNWRNLMNSSDIDSNDYAHDDARQAFRVGTGSTVDLGGWRSASGQDRTSSFDGP